MRIIKDTQIDFMSKSKIAGFLSGTIILVGIISLVINKGPNLSIDFKGGSMVAVNYTEPVDINEVRSALSNVSIDGQNFDFSQTEIKHFGDESNVAVRLPTLEHEPEQFSQKFVANMKNIFPDLVPKNENDFILSIEKVGPKIGAELSGKAVMAILSALALILVYISIRFEFKFAVGAIAALTHDVVVTLGVFSILGYEVSLAVIAAFLTIVGYSLNDTIVIFDRIRENIKNLKQVTMPQVVNQSINESLSRTIITSITTLFVLFTLYLYGGEVIHHFAFAMIIGVLVGTYSSVFVASPILVRMDSKL
ncbi:MAG: protein translocase subunit SecF [Candidatus Neomarinimicrobiota bacterium]|jgi:preprotein translocase SecF subunit|uniref:Protein translocase subunit SecF n=1 Tax=marine metagenome TaxID=408172 RepID=A0A381Z745_9ZZZZ|nr:protein translocase subunit SecF [Candidatus Neomarinimicrobiota bacterium]